MPTRDIQHGRGPDVHQLQCRAVRGDGGPDDAHLFGAVPCWAVLHARRRGAGMDCVRALCLCRLSFLVSLCFLSISLALTDPVRPWEVVGRGGAAGPLFPGLCGGVLLPCWHLQHDPEPVWKPRELLPRGVWGCPRRWAWQLHPGWLLANNPNDPGAVPGTMGGWWVVGGLTIVVCVVCSRL